MELGGYTDIPETLPEAQAMIVKLLNEAKEADRAGQVVFQGLQEARAMIEAARKALNAVEAPGSPAGG